VISIALNILKIKEAFPALSNRNILEIHNMAFSKQNRNKERKIQPTMKEPSRKQAIIPTSSKLTKTIMEDANSYVFQINVLLKNIKSTLHAEFICPCPGGMSIITNSVPNPSDLMIIKKHFKSIEGANNNEVLAPCLSQSKSYLKITGILTGILYISLNGNKLSSKEITDFVRGHLYFHP